MHSRKSIFSKGIVFILSFFAMAIFSFVKVEAAECEVSFKDGNQYLVIGGNNWEDKEVKLNDDCVATEFKVNSITVNGNEEKTSKFTISSRNPGHYTVGYNYSYKDSQGSLKSGVVYRYVRLLNSSFDTSNNYTLATFDIEGTSSVVDSYNVNDKYFINFVTNGTSTYIVAKDALGITMNNGVLEAKHSTLNFVVSRVIKNGDYFYLIGVNSEGNGVCLSYRITISEGSLTITPANSYNSTSKYISGFVNEDGIYLVGTSNTGYPVIDIVKANTLSNLYTHQDVKGEYRGVVVVNKVVYAVGYVKGDTDSNPTGLYTYYNESDSSKNSLSILGEGINTIFNDIVYDSLTGKNIVVGESVVNHIYANGALVATNTRQGYKDGVILQVSLDGTTITGAYMFGGNVDDTFNRIRLFNTLKDEETDTNYNVYYVNGCMDNDISNLLYSLNVANDRFNANVDKTSTSSTYMVNGVVNWKNGYAYYGSLSTNSVLGVYYPVAIDDGKDALFIVLDNRSFAPFIVDEDKDLSYGYETINIVKGDTNAKLAYCYYLVRYGKDDFKSLECEKDSNGAFKNEQTKETKLEYLFPTNTGAYIYIYRVVNIVSAPVPTNLSSGYTGILKWYTYNRSYVYTESNAERREVVDYSYSFTGGNSDKTIFDMIDYYFENGNTTGFSFFKYQSETGGNIFEVSSQTNAAFASIEYARKFAYYQEFSRVVKVSGEPLKGTVKYNPAVNENGDYYIYFIDYKGRNANTDVESCFVSSNYIDNCSAKGGYAFTDLNEVNQVIKAFLEYNNFFVSTRNTIYNGSIPASEVDEYKEELTTREYVNKATFSNNRNLTFNVYKLGEGENKTLAYSGTQKTVLFGGKLNKDGLYEHPSINGKITVVDKGEYYESDNYIFIEDNACYEVYYSYGDTKGQKRIFCLDTKGPVIVYKKDNSDDLSYQTESEYYGSSSTQKLKVESDFTIVDLEDLDEYSFIRINGVVYPITCSNNSESCLDDINKHIKRTFRYDVNNPGRVEVITFYDRLMNENTFYFVVGTIAPSIEVENETDEGFTLVIDFHDTNPISSASVKIFKQLCAGDSVNCYAPDANDTKAIIYNESAAFNEALTHYIYAVGYQDNTNEKELNLEITAKDGVYTIAGINYIIKDGYFVETDDSQTVYELDENSNMFTHESVEYSYNPALNVIQTLQVVDGEYRVDTEKNIPVVGNKFKFSENGKEFEIVKTEEKTIIKSINKKEQIYNDNLFKLNDVVYTIDFEKEVLSYKNPEVVNSKHIELEFIRTTDDKKGNYTGGVKIPKTVQVFEEDKITPVRDPITSLYAYEVIPENFEVFYLVDGIYQFSISQNGFEPDLIQVETKINVKDLELNIGYAPNHTGLEVVTGAQTDFERTDDVVSGDTVTVLALTRLEDNFKYSLNAGEVASSNLAAYENTNFMNRTVYAAYTPSVEKITVFSIKVYEEKNSYGLPRADNSTVCKEIIIYHGNVTPTELNVQECASYTYIHFDNQNIDTTDNKQILANLGITHVLTETGTFAFSGQNKFYTISLREYAKDEYGILGPSTKKISENFYIDTISPDDSTHTTINPFVYDLDSKDQDASLSGKTFSLDSGVYKLNGSIGSSLSVGFKINWYDSSVSDYRENKLLLVTIVTADGLVTCNLYQLISNKEASECSEVIDIEETRVYVNNDTTRKDSILAFTATGNYEVIFKDASGNSVAYEFTIDKTAPSVELTGSSMVLYENDPINKTTVVLNFDARIETKEYYILAYAKNPSFTIRLVDLSPVTKYCYYFDYGQANKRNECTDSAAVEHTFSFRDYIIDDVNADQYLANLSADMNVKLVIWAVDNLGNGEEDSDNDGTPDNITTIYFWADYKNPTNTFNQSDLNTEFVDSNEITNNNKRYNTVSVFASEYSGKTIVCEREFAFNDTRNGIKYTFSVLCNDIHNTTSTSYPNTYDFANTIYMKFYESDGVNKLADEFNFGLPTYDGNARWIYITTIDGVGNESDNYIIIPIFVQDEIPPRVVEGYKVVGEDKTLLVPVNYPYLETKTNTVYLANDSIELTLSEPIAKIRAYSASLYKDGTLQTLTCSVDSKCDGYYAGLQFDYSNTNPMIKFTFSNVNENEYKLIVFIVEDFAGKDSGEIVVVIDRVNPNISFKETGGDDETLLDTLEYITNKRVYNREYMTSGHREHIVTVDDQRAPLSVSVKYYMYEPKVTHNNYIYINREFKRIDNGTERSTTTKYYVLIKESALNNKNCEGKTQINGVTYCYVEDTQSYYYFDSLLDDTSENYWKDYGTIIDSSKIGVYRISYVVSDYAGNISETIYKKIFVNDTVNPDIDIYKDSASATPMYSNLTSSNNSNFEGKLNMSVTFKGKDTSVAADTRIVLYRCGITEYYAKTCTIDQPLFSDNSAVIRGESFSNVYNIGKKLNDAVYKAFVYDVGQYVSLSKENMVTHQNVEETIYSLTHNSAHFYFAVKVSEIDAKYTVYGNKYTSGYNSYSPYPYISYVQSATNYYVVKNGTKDSDVYLVVCDKITGECVDKSAGNMIGYTGGKVEFIDSNKDASNISVVYYNAKGVPIYEVNYERYYGELLLHETYHNVNLSSKNVKVCKYINGKNECEEEEFIYKVTGVTATIYEEGTYLLMLKDRYGNLSQIVESFTVDNSAYTSNKNENLATGVNYWFSVPSQVITSENSVYLSNLVNIPSGKDINPLEARFAGNFNSEFFYAFANYDDAIAYLDVLYTNEIEKQLNKSGFTFYGIDGQVINTYNNVTTSDVMNEIRSVLPTMVFNTFTQDKRFDDSKIKQIPYIDDNTSSSMYKYVYVRVKETIANGVVSKTYTLVESDTCIPGENETCVKVDLKIVSANNTSISLRDGADNDISCLMSGTGGASSGSGIGCNQSYVTTGAKYIFIDKDVSAYHENVVFYGIIAYTDETINIVHNELGGFVSLDKFIIYDEPGVVSEDRSGRYIIVDSQYVLLDEIVNTNLYSDGKVYVTYLTRYDLIGGKYTLASNGEYYYDYSTMGYDLVGNLDIEYTFNNEGKMCDDKSCNIPYKVNTTTIVEELSNTLVRQVNKKTYIELFSHELGDFDQESNIFEINAIVVDGKYTHVYSYATLGIRYNSSDPYVYENINKYIKIDKDKTRYRAVLDIETEKYYDIVIIDRAGNRFNITYSHSSIVPTISYQKDNESSTSSSVSIKIETESHVATLIKNNVKILKHTGSSFEPYFDATCLGYVEDISNTQATVLLTLNFKYVENYDCSGVYRVEVIDSHGNTNYKEFVFNPYDLTTSYEIDPSENTIYGHYIDVTNGDGSTSTINGVIINKVFTVNVDANKNYLVVNRYAPYSLANLTSPTSTITISDFSISYDLGSCPVEIERISGGIYAISIVGLADHSCDGIYTVDIINRFSRTILDSEFISLEGADQQLVTSRVRYENAESVEIDTTAPDSTYKDGEDTYFSLVVDEVTNVLDTNTLIRDGIIYYTNKYVTVSWGGLKEHSFASLKYRVTEADAEYEGAWNYENSGTRYDGNFASSYTFKLTNPGVYTCEFMFVDVLRNEDANQIYTIVITVKAPSVGFFEVDETGTQIGEQYDKGERIGERTILRCIDDIGSGSVDRPCTLSDYKYVMSVNGVEYPAFNNNVELADIISRDSYWLVNTPAQYAEELRIRLIASVIGKDDITTELSIIIDKKAPEIYFDGVKVKSTFIGVVKIDLSDEDASNSANIYYCDKIENNECYLYASDGTLISGKRFVAQIEEGSFTYSLGSSYSGYFMVEATDNLGNTFKDWFVLDNEAPTVTITTENATISQNMFTNAKSVFVNVNDKLSTSKEVSFDIEFTPFHEKEDTNIEYNALIGLTKEGKYVITPKDGVNNKGRSVTFYIYRQTPKYTITTNNEEDTHVVNTEVSLSWLLETNELAAPIVSVTMDGKLYEAVYDSVDKKYVGVTVTEIGEHTFVITDAAGNRSIIMVTINNTNKVCINGVQVEVKMQAYYNVDNLSIGAEKGVQYAVDDVVIFALPTQVTNGDCANAGILGYRTLDPENSYYLIENERNATLFNKNKYDFIKYGFISEGALNEIRNVGGTVVVFVVTKDMANGQLGYKVGTNFFLEDPIGWSMIFVSILSLVWPTCRIFIKKKVRVI